ncbi:MAG: hypothetical protein IJE23_05725 [Tyzzerella sp.]|nr:hypothetical protein [Tyzzerella sp.]
MLRVGIVGCGNIYDCVENDKEFFLSGREALKIQKLICEIYYVEKKHFE